MLLMLMHPPFAALGTQIVWCTSDSRWLRNTASHKLLFVYQQHHLPLMPHAMHLHS
jgi:hypothetical protein